MNNPKKWLNLALLLVIFVSSLSLSACSGKSAATAAPGAQAAAAASMPGHANHMMAPASELPAEVKSAPTNVQEAYQFAIANPAVLKQLPCYCGCGGMGHTSLYSCYVSSVEADGKIKFDTHALGCSICVDIAQDAMRELNDGKTLAQAKSYVDQTYAQYGTSNLP